MKIYFASDHAGFELKSSLKKELEDNGHEVEDMGPFELDPEDDYPDFASKAAEAVAHDPGTRGIIIGGSGQGEAMVANRVHGVRAAVFYGPVAPKQAVDIDGEETSDPYSTVRLPRLHNNANILSIGARFVTTEEAKTAVRVFLDTIFLEGERHVRRLAKF